MNSVKLSVLVPVYDESATVLAALARILGVDYPVEVEVVVVDDGSSDATPTLLRGVEDPRVRVVTHPVNRGKGAAIRTAAEHATGDYMIIVDADLEYHPEEVPSLLAPVLSGEAVVVYGTRTFGSHTAYSFWYVMGNKTVTMAANVLFDCWISDLETCFKLLPLPLYRELDIQSQGFGMEAEVTAKVLARGIRPFEVPITYQARSREEGKKLTWKDGVEALWILTRERSRGKRLTARRPGRTPLPR
ncbi:MAG: glycosyl transferase [Frankiales bacterium]|nr:glycosyl transferase [Frankiales bacterium]